MPNIFNWTKSEIHARPLLCALALLALVGVSEIGVSKITAQEVATEAEAPAVEKTIENAEPAEREKVRLAHFTLASAMPESPGEQGPFGDQQADLRKSLERISKAAADKNIAGAVLRIEQPKIGRGKLHEVRGAIQQFRESGKKIVAELAVASPVDYLIASACDEIVMPESGYLQLPGVHAEATFFKGTLDKLGVEADFMHIGPYKGAAQPMMRKQLSPEVRENMTALIDDLYDQLLTTIANDRLLTVDQVRAVVDKGILTAGQALEAGMIDRIAYTDELRDELTESYQAEPLVYVKNYGKKEVDTDFSGPMGFMKLLKLVMGVDTGKGRAKTKKIAIVYAVGPITTGKSKNDPFGSESMGSSTMVEALRKANDDKQVAAIVLRINSPGGSAVASDLIWRETQRIKKPIVASMGDVAGSGGYYIAMGADKIYAAPGTVTGSIGVVSGKFAIRGLYEKLGVTIDTIHRGKNSGMFGSSGKFSDSEREAMQGFMEDIYLQFTSKAAQGRGISLEALQALAEGRIYTGRQAKRNGLVDEIGTLDDAISAAKLLAGLDKDEKVRFKMLPEPTNFFESLFGDLDAEEEARIMAGIERLAPELASQLRHIVALRQVFQEPAAVIMPFELRIR